MQVNIYVIFVFLFMLKNLPFLPLDTMLARYMLLPCVRLSVCHKSEFFKTAEHFTTQTTPHDTIGTLVSYTFLVKFQWGHRQQERQKHLG